MKTRYEIMPWRFWDKLLVGDGCWEWQAASNFGYGIFRWNRRNWFAHRVAWTLWNGPIPPGLKVLHHCDNPPCCRPDHLYVGTQADNLRDARQRKRLTSYWQSVTHCRNNHEYNEANTLYGTQRNGYQRRRCRICSREEARRRYQQRKEEA